MEHVLARPDTVVPTPSDAELAARASRLLATGRSASAELRIKMDDGEELLLPQAATRLLGHILTEMALGNAVTLVPVHAEFTTQEAADYLNVSRPHLIALLEGGHVPFHKVGSHRRIRFSDVEAFASRQRAKSMRNLDELARQAQELGMGY